MRGRFWDRISWRQGHGSWKWISCKWTAKRLKQAQLTGSCQQQMENLEHLCDYEIHWMERYQYNHNRLAFLIKGNRRQPHLNTLIMIAIKKVKQSGHCRSCAQKIRYPYWVQSILQRQNYGSITARRESSDESQELTTLSLLNAVEEVALECSSCNTDETLMPNRISLNSLLTWQAWLSGKLM